MDAIKLLSSETSRAFSLSSTTFNWDHGVLFSAELREAARALSSCRTSRTAAERLSGCLINNCSRHPSLQRTPSKNQSFTISSLKR